MMDARGTRTVLAALALGALVFAVGCGTSKESKEPAGTTLSAPVPAPPPPSLREAGAQLADEATLKALVQGKTTRAEVRDRFGVPQEVVLSPGVETFIYYRERTSGWIRRSSERTEMLTVRFDSEGLLKDFEYRFAGK